MNVTRASSKLALLLIVAIVATVPLMADSMIYTDPANLHIGTGAGTSGQYGLGSDPNTIGSGSSFDIYYNTQGNGNLPVGDPFYLIFAIPVYTGSSSANSAPGTATFYNPPNANTNVTVDKYKSWGTMTSSDIYAFIGWADKNNNSFSFVNMKACDIGSNTCPNTSIQGANAPLAGKTITGFDIFTYTIETTQFGPGDMLDFQGSSLPLGSYVAALGVDFMGYDNKGNKIYEGWSVPFTQSGLTTDRKVPEPASLVLLGSGLLALGTIARRRMKK